jgi:predicted transcriptional regulator
LTGRRSKIRIYLELLQSVHLGTRAGVPLTRYYLERRVGLTHVRLGLVLSHLREAGFIEDGFRLTDKGYGFLTEFSSKVVPVLEKYGFSIDSL